MGGWRQSERSRCGARPYFRSYAIFRIPFLRSCVLVPYLFFQDRFSSNRLSEFLTILFRLIFKPIFSSFAFLAFLTKECCHPVFWPGRLAESQEKCWRRYTHTLRKGVDLT